MEQASMATRVHERCKGEETREEMDLEGMGRENREGEERREKGK